jgi:hypothetical protein
LDSFGFVVQALGGKNLSISGLTHNLREYAASPSKSNWEEVQHYLNVQVLVAELLCPLKALTPFPFRCIPGVMLADAPSSG